MKNSCGALVAIDVVDDARSRHRGQLRHGTLMVDAARPRLANVQADSSDWHFAAYRAHPLKGRYRANNGQRAVRGLNWSAAFNPEQT